ncbi:hypothetical protein D3C79_575470 [compost metagenome]
MLAVAQAPLQGVLVANVVLLLTGSVPVFQGQVTLVGVSVGAATVVVVGAAHFSTFEVVVERGFVGGLRLWRIFERGGDFGGLARQLRRVVVAFDVLALVVARRVGVAEGTRLHQVELALVLVCLQARAYGQAGQAFEAVERALAHGAWRCAAAIAHFQQGGQFSRAAFIKVARQHAFIGAHGFEQAAPVVILVRGDERLVVGREAECFLHGLAQAVVEVSGAVDFNRLGP